AAGHHGLPCVPRKEGHCTEWHLRKRFGIVGGCPLAEIKRTEGSHSAKGHPPTMSKGVTIAHAAAKTLKEVPLTCECHWVQTLMNNAGSLYDYGRGPLHDRCI
ncbi:MAG TPA: hypothetical protein VNQ14_04535, partial [Woeseiaceae bacterium]|nr:hypothetical protein [Woeseiaceae bacterium]